MEARHTLRSVVEKASGTAVRSRRASSLSALLTRKFVVPVLMLASVGALGSALPGARQAAAAHAPLPRAAAVAVCVHKLPWMYAHTNKLPWMYAATNKMPWMYAATNKLPWMYARTNKMPWMYASRAGHTTTPRAACAATTRRQLA
jgi:hypothetical protein